MYTMYDTIILLIEVVKSNKKNLINGVVQGEQNNMQAKKFVLRKTLPLRVPHLEQELPILQEHPSSPQCLEGFVFLNL
jgi:hypothetical protein